MIAMTARNLELFADRNEQLQWIHSAMSEYEDAWCIVERPRIRQRSLVAPSDVTDEMLGNQFSRSRIFLGRSTALRVPQWRATRAGEDLDFVQSLAVLFEPSFRTREAIVAGRVAIMRASDYAAVGLRDQELASWYRALVRSLRTALGAVKTSLVVVGPGHPRMPARGTFIVSSTAESEARAGTPLKQFQESNVVLQLA